MYIFHMFLLCNHSNDNHQHRYGVSWHKSGQKTNKQNVFDDFIAAGEYLIENKYTTAKQLAIMGGSNGALVFDFSRHNRVCCCI